MLSGSKGIFPLTDAETKSQMFIRTFTKCLLNLEAAKHEKVAIYAVNQQTSSVCRIARVDFQRSNS